MGVSGILAAIDRDIAQLRQARALLADGAVSPVKRKVGRPKKAVGAAFVAAKPAKRRKKRNLTPEGRQRIAEAVKKRWAAQKKAAK